MISKAADDIIWLILNYKPFEQNYKKQINDMQYILTKHIIWTGLHFYVSRVLYLAINFI